MAEIRRLPIARSLHRPALLFGAERELVLFTALIVSVFMFSAVYTTSKGVLIMAIAAGCAWFVALGLFRAMAKADPMMTKVYMRHVRQAAYYQSRSRPWRQDRQRL